MPYRSRGPVAPSHVKERTRHGGAIQCKGDRPARRSASRLAQQKRERGRRAAAILGNGPAPVRRPRRCAAVPRVQAHRQRASDPTLWRSTPGCGVRDRLSDCARGCQAPQPEGVRAVCCQSAQPRSATPDLERTSWSSRHACERKHSRGLVRVHRRPCGAWLRHDAPRKTLKLDASLYRARRGQYAGGGGGGDKVPLLTPTDRRGSHVNRAIQRCRR
jgi:hypothetical protein